MADGDLNATRFQLTGDRKISSAEEEIVRDILQDFSEHQLWRNTFAAQWEEVAELILPTSRNTFFYGNWNWPGQKKTDRQVDATGMMALHRFGAIMDSLLTPRNQMWHALGSDHEYLMKDRAVRLWYQSTTKKLFKQRYSALANFSGQNQMVYTSLGAFGTGGMFIDQAENNWGVPIQQLRYKNIPLGELFLMENHQGLIDGCIRWFRLTARQAHQKFGAKMPPALQAALQQHSQMPFDFLHVVRPRRDYEHGRLDHKGKAFESYYVSIQGRCLCGEGGYNSLPIVGTRYEQTPGELYGRSPAMMVLPALKTLNAEKATFLKQGHRAGDPVLLTADDGLLDSVSLRPGSMNKGGVTSDGKPLVHVLPSGDIQVTKEMMDEERSLIGDAFLVSLFQILTETPTMTATEVIERTNEKGILLAPTVGSQQSAYIGPTISREIDLLSAWGVLDPMPPLLREAKGDYEVAYTSPLARAQRAQEIAGFQRTIQSTLEVVNATQDPSPLDNFNLDVATVETARIQAVPETWMASDDEVQAKRKNRAAAQEQQAKIQAMPAQAAMMKAQSVLQKGQSAAAIAQARGAPNPNQPMGPQGVPQGPGQ